jgi:hypothetical protein
MTKPDKPFYDKRIFWFVDSDKMDVVSKANFIIERVFERGDVEDIRYCRRFYGDEKIRIALEKAKWLILSTIYIATALFDNKLTDYKCFSQIQSDPLHSLY